jgi:hypothetical protein
VPLAPARKAMWMREMELLLSVADTADSIVERTPSIQELLEGGGQFEVMVPRPRSDPRTAPLGGPSPSSPRSPFALRPPRSSTRRRRKGG